MDENNSYLRRQAIINGRQLIVKAGTRLLIDRESIAILVDGIAKLRQHGHKVLLVTSGAVGMGMEVQKLKHRPKELAVKQALAAIGQTRLMSIYTKECARHGFDVAQLLLTAADLRNRQRYLNIMNCIYSLWERNVLPIVNENDSVSVDELKFGDNDTLAGMLTSLTGAGLTILLTTVDGLRCRDENGNLTERIPIVPELTPAIHSLAGGTDNSEFSIGGMASKLRAAELATASGAYLWIADGRDRNVIEHILNGEDTGTLFLPRKHQLRGRKRWVGFFSRVSGKLEIDDGAVEAITHHGKSLLPSGVRTVSGTFKRGDTVEIAAVGKAPFARGLINFNSDECRKISGCHSVEIIKLLGEDADEELVHRDNLTLLELE